MEKDNGITEHKQVFYGKTYVKRHAARSLHAARGYAKKLREKGYPHVHIEKVGIAKYLVFTHGRAVRGRK